jgi:hypothetical protein
MHDGVSNQSLGCPHENALLATIKRQCSRPTSLCEMHGGVSRQSLGCLQETALLATVKRQCLGSTSLREIHGDISSTLIHQRHEMVPPLAASKCGQGPLAANKYGQGRDYRGKKGRVVPLSFFRTVLRFPLMVMSGLKLTSSSVNQTSTIECVVVIYTSRVVSVPLGFYRTWSNKCIKGL